jgi:hypothetical protein
MAKFDDAEWARARERLGALTDDAEVLRAFDQARRAKKIDGRLLNHLHANGIAVSDIFKR